MTARARRGRSSQRTQPRAGWGGGLLDGLSWVLKLMPALVLLATAPTTTTKLGFPAGASNSAGCSSSVESVALIGGETVDAATIDRDPLSLLPGGVILLGYLDAVTLWRTDLGPDVTKLAQNLIPLGPEANFVPSRDVVKIYGGVYAMQGADFCMVVQGHFDVDAIQRSAEARVMTTSGVPLVKTRYAGNDLFTAGNVGFVVLTSNTLLSGNETGMRRALDRLRFSKLERSVPMWMSDLTSTPNASFTLAGDFGTQVPMDALVHHAPFMAGLRQLRILGNFHSPGVNFAGTLTYADAQGAASGAQSLRSVQSVAQLMGLLSSLGFGGSLPTMQVRQEDRDVQFTLPVDGRYASFLLRLGIAATSPIPSGATPAPIQPRGNMGR